MRGRKCPQRHSRGKAFIIAGGGGGGASVVAEKNQEGCQKICCGGGFSKGLPSSQKPGGGMFTQRKRAIHNYPRGAQPRLEGQELSGKGSPPLKGASSASFFESSGASGEKGIQSRNLGKGEKNRLAFTKARIPSSQRDSGRSQKKEGEGGKRALPRLWKARLRSGGGACRALEGQDGGETQKTQKKGKD